MKRDMMVIYYIQLYGYNGARNFRIFKMSGRVFTIALFYLSTPPWALAFSMQKFSSITITISSQGPLADSRRNSASRLRINKSLITFMAGFGASKDASAKGSKFSKGKTSSGGSGASHSSSSFPPAMLKRFRQLKEAGCSVV
jgi:hypothetical protein